MGLVRASLLGGQPKGKVWLDRKKEKHCRRNQRLSVLPCACTPFLPTTFLQAPIFAEFRVNEVHSGETVQYA